ncbi:MAG: DUF5702 domain-containing protein [Clostridia bacterium]|nr:DUF5702 domain-containing protein [Clostridia bacterium]
MYSFASKCKGSISLFLSIILLPTLTFTGLMVDSANLALSKSMVENAGELTTNAALANYDTVLKDVYGLLAMSQVGEKSVDAGNYFANTMQAQNLMASVTSAVSGLNQDMKDFIGIEEDKSVNYNSNFLNVSYDNFDAIGVAGSSLRNYKILKNQIVEFMKYRGPAEIAMDLFASTGSFGEVDAKVDVTAAKTTVDATKGELGTVCRVLYTAIEVYDKRVESFKAAEKEWATKVNELNESMRLANEYLITWVVNAPDMGSVRFMEFDPDEDLEKYELEDADVSLPSQDLSSVKLSFESSIRSCRDRMTSLQEKMNTYDSLSSSEKRRFFDDYLKFYEDLKLAMTCYKTINAELDDDCLLTQEQNESNSDFKSRVKKAREETAVWLTVTANTLLEDVYKFSISSQGYIANYRQTVQEYENKAQQEYNSVIEIYAKYYLGVANLTGLDPKTGGPLLKYFLIKSTEFKQRVSHGSNYDYMLMLCNSVQEKFNQLKTDNNNLRIQNEKYGEATSKDAYYQEMSGEISKNDVTFDINDLQELREQIVANQNYVEKGIATKFNSYIFYGKELINLTTFDKFKKALESKFKNDSEFNPENYDVYFDQYFPQKFETQKVAETDTCFLKRIDEGGKVFGGKTFNVPAFYAYLVTRFSGYTSESKIDEEVTESASEISNEVVEEVSKDEVPNVYSMDVFSSLNTQGGDLNLIDISGVSDDSSTGILRMFSSMATKVKGIFQMFKNGWGGLADNLLVTEYAFQNFSFATMDKLKEKENGGKDFQTPTLLNINSKNNKIYGCEIEYILEGYRGQKGSKPKWWQFWKDEVKADGPEKNVKIVKSQIFLLRFVLNSIFAFTSNTLRTQTEAPAQALSVACWGAVPASVWQVILELILSLCETSRDLSKLMDGEEMPVYKTDDTWFFKLGGGSIDAAIEDAKNKVSNYVADQASDFASGIINSAESYIGQMVSGVTSDISKKTSDVLTQVNTELTTVATEQMTNLISAMGDAVKDYVEEQYLKIMTDGLKFDKKNMKADLEEILKGYYKDNEKLDKDFKEVLDVAAKGMVDIIMDSDAVKKLEEYSKKMEYKPNLGTDFDTKVVINGSTIAEIMNGTSTTINSYIEGIMGDLQKKVQNTVDTYLKEAENEVNSKVSEYGDKVEEWTDQKSEELGASVNNWLNESLGSDFSSGGSGGSAGSLVSGSTASSGSVGEQSSFVGKLLNFSYKDYLRIFLFFNLQGNKEDEMLQRIDDVIELNVKGGLQEYYADIGVSGHPAGQNFGMNNAFTYVQISSKIHVKPLLLSQKIFSSGLNGVFDMWSYDYSNVQGY